MACRLLQFAVVAVLALEGRVLEAQQERTPPTAPSFPRFEASIMAGYRFEGDMTFFENSGPYRQVEFDNAPTFGLTLGYNSGPALEWELQYSYANPSVTAFALDPARPDRNFSVGVHDIQLVPQINFGAPTDRLRVFIGIGAGVTILDSREAVVDTVLPSFSVSLGVKTYLSDHVGLRFEFHYVPAFLYTTGDGVELCFDQGGCWNTGNRYLQQVDFRAGATFRF
jgi:hypothetical protein